MRAAVVAVCAGVVALAAAVPGCTAPASDLRLSGAFTADRTQADLDDFHATVRTYSQDVAILESFPEQFVVNGLGAECKDLRAALAAKRYVARVSDCTA